jgi:hypothetical protein
MKVMPMTPLITALVVALTTTFAFDIGIASAQAPIQECGDLRHRLAYNITTRNVSCRSARRTVRRWNNTVAGKGGDGRVLGLYCDYRDIGYEAGDIRCTGSRGRVVRWQTAS